MRIPGSPVAYAGAGAVVAVGFALAVALSTEPTSGRADRALLAYAECLDAFAPARGAIRWPDARVAPCAPSRAGALAACLGRSGSEACAARLSGVDADPSAAARLAAEAAAPRPRVAGPLHADPARARWGLAAAVAVALAVLAARRPPAERVERVAAGAILGVAASAVPALAGLVAGTLLALASQEAGLILVGFGLVAASFAAVFGMPALAGGLDAGADAGRRVHASLATVAAGMAGWNVLVGPVPSAATAWAQLLAGVALAIAGYLLPGAAGATAR